MPRQIPSLLLQLNLVNWELPTVIAPGKVENDPFSSFSQAVEVIGKDGGAFDPKGVLFS